MFAFREIGDVVRVNGEPWEVVEIHTPVMVLKPREDIAEAMQEQARQRTMLAHKYLQERIPESAEAYLKALEEDNHGMA